MPVITISREFGSVGDDFGECIARALGYHCVCKEEIADLLSQSGMVEFGQAYESRPGFWEGFATLRDQRRTEMVAMLNEVVRAVAHHGNAVIQGRSGYAILQGFADVLHVRLRAPVEVRVTNVMEQKQLQREHAEGMVKVRDSVRTAFVERFYGVPWDAIQAFDLVINSEKVLPDLAVTWVASAAQGLALVPITDRPSTRSLKVDEVLARAVSKMLGCTEPHH